MMVCVSKEYLKNPCKSSLTYKYLDFWYQSEQLQIDIQIKLLYLFFWWVWPSWRSWWRKQILCIGIIASMWIPNISLMLRTGHPWSDMLLKEHLPGQAFGIMTIWRLMFMAIFRVMAICQCGSWWTMNMSVNKKSYTATVIVCTFWASNHLVCHCITCWFWACENPTYLQEWAKMGFPQTSCNCRSHEN